MSPQNLLIIDDDIELTELLHDYLTAHEFHVITANEPKQGLEWARHNRHIDLILLDVMMPEMDGFELLKQLRQSRTTPVLMLTARGDDIDRIVGLELGADDYLPKPFNHRELIARIKAILRRVQFTPALNEQRELHVNGIDLYPCRQMACILEHEMVLTGTEFAILKYLMLNATQLVSKDDISEQVLGRKLVAFDRSIDMHVSNIRKKISELTHDEKIKTIRGSGYIFLSENT